MKLPHFQISLHYGTRLNPARDWFVLVAAALLGLVVGVFWSGWLFFHVAGGGVLGHASTPTSSVFNAASLTALEQIMSTREGEAAKYKSGEHSFVDPSK